MNEEFVTARIPIASFRRKRKIPPGVPMEMLQPVYTKHVPRHGPNLQASHIPNDYADASRHFDSKRSW